MRREESADLVWQPPGSVPADDPQRADRECAVDRSADFDLGIVESFAGDVDSVRGRTYGKPIRVALLRAAVLARAAAVLARAAARRTAHISLVAGLRDNGRRTVGRPQYGGALRATFRRMDRDVCRISLVCGQYRPSSSLSKLCSLCFYLYVYDQLTMNVIALVCLPANSSC